MAWCDKRASQPARKEKNASPNLAAADMACLAGVSGAGRSAKQNLIYYEVRVS